MSSYKKYPNLMISLWEENGHHNSNRVFISWRELTLHTLIEAFMPPLSKGLSTKKRFPMFPTTLSNFLSKTWGWVPILFCRNKIFRSPLQIRINSYTLCTLMVQSERRDPIPTFFMCDPQGKIHTFLFFGLSSPTSTTWYSMKH